jgi:hypothetical protein
MDTNSDQIVQQIRNQFESLLASMLTQAPTADQMERRLFSGLIQLGRSMFLAFIMFQEARLHGIQAVQVDGQVLPLHSRRRRSLRTVFGKISFTRGYYFSNGMRHFLLDARLNLPKKSMSDMLREWLLKLACEMPYKKAGKNVGDIIGQAISTRAIEEAVAEDGAIAEGFYERKDAPAKETEEPILVLQGDGKGVPMRMTGGRNPGKVRVERGGRKTKKKEAIVTTIYTIAPCVRTPEQVVASLFKEEPEFQGERDGPRNKQLWATLKGKATAAEFAAKQVCKRIGDHIKWMVVLTDGCESLQKHLTKRLAGFVLVLDIIHALEYLWQAANGLLGETSDKREEWVRNRLLLMLNGQTQQLIDEFKTLADVPSRKKLAKSRLLAAAAYYERNLSHMRYDEYLRQGWPIGTGVVEGACRHLVKDRCELSGMRWCEPGAESLLRLRSVAENDDWNAFQSYRKCTRSEQLYKCRAPATELERLATRNCGPAESPMAA